MKKNQSVLVTTEFKGVFYGEIKDNLKLPEEITIFNARNCIYWSSDLGGFLGLVAQGPDSNCKIGPIIPELTLYKITSVSPITDKEVIKKWKSE